MLLTASQGAIAGAVGGMAAGVVARGAMRLVALGVPDGTGIMQVPIFTVQGSLFILVIGAIVGAPLGAIFALVHASLPGPHRTLGLLFGLLVMGTLGPLFFAGAPDEFINAGRIVLFIALFPVFGVVAEIALHPSERIARALPASVRTLPLAVAIGGAGLVLFGIVQLTTNAVGVHGANAVWLFASWLVLVAGVRLYLRTASAPTRTQAPE